MLTFEKVLEVFGDYLAQDKACEVLTTSRGYLAVDWESRKNNWVTARGICYAPATRNTRATASPTATNGI